MRKAVLRTVLAEHLEVLRRRRAELEHILSGESRLFDEGAQSQARDDLGWLKVVERGFAELLPKAWNLSPGHAPHHAVNRVTEAKALARGRATAAVIAMTLQQSDREHREDDADRLLVATALFRYLRDVLGLIETAGSEGDQKAVFDQIAAAGTL